MTYNAAVTCDDTKSVDMAGLLDVVRGTPAIVSGVPSRHVHRVHYGDACVRVDAAQEVSLVLNLSESHRARRRSEGRVTAADPFVGATTLIPPGYPASFELSGTARVLMMQLPWAVVRQSAEEDGHDADSVELQPRLAFDDPVLARLLYAAVSALEGEPEPVGPIVQRLITAHGAQLGSERPVTGGLSPMKLRRVRDRIEASLDEPPTLGSLAAEAGLSLFHFAREFRRNTGLPPHRYILRRQLDRATMLLADRDLAIADIAAASGFAHASHLARHLRRRTGLSPDAFRTRVVL